MREIWAVNWRRSFPVGRDGEAFMSCFREDRSLRDAGLPACLCPRVVWIPHLAVSDEMMPGHPGHSSFRVVTEEIIMKQVQLNVSGMNLDYLLCNYPETG